MGDDPVCDDDPFFVMRVSGVHLGSPSPCRASFAFRFVWTQYNMCYTISQVGESYDCYTFLYNRLTIYSRRYTIALPARVGTIRQGDTMTERKLIAVRLEPKHIQRLSEMSGQTGWTQSEVIRRLIEQAQVVSAEVSATVKKGAALAVSVN